MDIPRRLHLEKTLLKKSCFLFGPRQTGKTWLIRKQLGAYKAYNLLDSDVYLKLSRSPKRIREECSPDEKIIIIDEIQKLSSLLNEVQILIEEFGYQFLLTGSSARKLRQGGVNLLGGRARLKYLHPLSFSELKNHFDLTKALNHGLLPSLYFSEEPDEDLKAYVGSYLKEEIAAEGLTRNIPAFSRFLEVAALCNGKILNYTKIANDAQVPRSTVQEYFNILKDTLIAYELPVWKKTLKRKPIATSKLFFFDVGVVRHLQNRSPVQLGSPEFGELFETYLFHELKCFTDYVTGENLFYWRTSVGVEVDFILGEHTAIEVKTTSTVREKDLKGLKFLRQEQKLKNYILVCFEKTPRKVDGIHILPWEVFLTQLWDQKFIA